MKRSAIAALAAASLLAGCGGEDEAAPAQSNPDRAYLELARQVFPDFTDDGLFDIRANVCEVMKASPDTVGYMTAVETISDAAGVSTEQAVGVAVPAIMSGCPEYEDAILR